MDISNISNAPLKIVFLVHFILATWGTQGHWSPSSYLLYNLVFFVILLWGIHHKDSEEPIQMGVCVNSCCILLDVIVLSVYFPESYRGTERFSVGMAILNLVLRPVTTVVLFRVFQDRVGAFGNLNTGNFGDLFGGKQRGPYEDIDSAVQSVPHASGDLGSPTTSPYPGVLRPMDEKVPPPYHG